MDFLSAAAPFAAYRAGRSDEAAELAKRVITADPNAGEAHMCLALISLRAGDTAATIESLRRCARVRSADWIVAQLRADFSQRGSPGVPTALTFRLGGFLRSHLTSLGAPLAPDHRRSDHAYVNVVGTSYVRSFGGSTALFPLFIGMGPTMLLLTEQAAALTRRTFASNMERIDPTRDTLLVVGGDAFYHVHNLLKTRDGGPGNATEADYALMSVVARRHAEILADARKRVTGRLYLLGSTPTFSDLVNDLGLRLNEELRPVCAAHDVELLDVWDELADPVTNHLRADFSANAYPGDIHYSLETTPIFIRALKARGSLPAETPETGGYDWTSVFECELDKAERTRIWCEPSVSPSNAFKSDKIASSHLGGRLADFVTCLTAAAGERTLAMVNVRDGYLPVAVPPRVTSGCLALTDSASNREAAQMALDFFGRSDVALHLFGETALQAAAKQRFWGLVLLIHPDSAEADERRCNEVLARIGGADIVIVGAPHPNRVANLNVGARTVRHTIPISNKHIPAKWADYSLVVLS